MIEAMRFGRIEIAYFGPFSYVLAKSKAHEIEPFAVGIERGSPTYNSVVVAQVAGPVASVADIRGKDFGFGDQASTSSHLIPRALLLKNGLEAGKDYRPVHLGAHDAVARAVQNGQVPAGALSKAVFRGAARAQDHRPRQGRGHCHLRSDSKLSDGDAGQPRAGPVRMRSARRSWN